MVWNKAVFCVEVVIYKCLQIWRHNYVIGRNEYLICTFSESAIPYVYSLQFLFKSSDHSWRYERKCEWVFFSEHSVYDDMCRMGSWSFWSWFDVNQSIHCWRICAKKTIFTFSFQWPWSLTFRPQICSPRYSSQRYATTILEVSKAFLFRENRRHWTNRGTRVRDCRCNT